MIVSEITNNAEVLSAIEVYHRMRVDAEAKIADLNAELKPYMDRLKGLVNTHGGYDQDGIKAYFELRKTYEYMADFVRDNLPPDLAKVCIVDAVNTKALEGLHKGKLITDDQLARCRIVTKGVEAFVCPLPKGKAEVKDDTPEG